VRRRGNEREMTVSRKVPKQSQTKRRDGKSYGEEGGDGRGIRKNFVPDVNARPKSGLIRVMREMKEVEGVQEWCSNQQEKRWGR
jgi:hypothetical protein